MGPLAQTRGIIIDLGIALLDGRVVPIKIDQEEDVAGLKKVIEQATGIGADVQKILFEGQEMIDDMVLVEVGVMKNDKLTMDVSDAQKARAELCKRGISDGDREVVTAAKDGDVEVLEWLMNVGTTCPNATDGTDNSALMHAAKEAKLVAMQILLNHGADVNHRGCGNETAAHWAAAAGHLEAVTFLHEAGADVTLTDDEGDTPLMWAAAAGHVACCRFLALHCDVTAKNADGDTALDWAEGEGFTEVVNFLGSL